jgi:hypothetical protein
MKLYVNKIYNNNPGLNINNAITVCVVGISFLLTFPPELYCPFIVVYFGYDNKIAQGEYFIKKSHLFS